MSGEEVRIENAIHAKRPTRLPELAPLVRNRPAGKRLRHPHRAEAPGSLDVSTTMIYCHVLNRGRLGIHIPADLL